MPSTDHAARLLVPYIPFNGRPGQVLSVGLVCVSFVLACSRSSNLEKVDETEGTERRVGTLKNGEKHGQWTRYDSGALYEIEEWRDGVLHGPFRRFHDDRSLLSDGVHRNGILHGRYRVFFENGHIAQLSWFDLGRRDQTWCEWHPNGALRRFVVYQDDKIIREQFDPPGTCPLVHGDGARHLDPKDTSYR